LSNDVAVGVTSAAEAAFSRRWLWPG